MADVHEIRGASVTARGSAPVHRDSPFRWLTHPRRDEFTPSRKRGANRPVVWASATLRRIASGPPILPAASPTCTPGRTAALLPSPWKSSSARRSSPASQRQKVQSFGTRVRVLYPRAYFNPLCMTV